MNVKIHKDDNVYVLTGKDKGKKGKVTRVFPKERLVLVEKLNLVKRHLRPSNNLPQGGIQEVERPINISNLAIVCPHCGRRARVGHRLLDDGKRVRICRQCKEILD